VKLNRIVRLAFASCIALLVVACSGTSSGPTPPEPISVTFLNPPVTSLNTGTSTGLTAVVNNDTNNAGVIWKVSCGSSSCGTIGPVLTASGASSTYTAPSAVPAAATVTVTATSVTDNTKFISVSITITSAPPPAVSVSFVTQPPSSMVISTSSSLAASVSNDTKNGGLIWSVSCGSSQCGSFNPTTTGSGSLTNYTAPNAVPTPATVTVTATSVTDSTKSTSATITIAASAPPIISDGNYVYHLSGQDNNNSYYVVGAFSIKNGVITGGEEDYTDSANYGSNPLVLTNSGITATGGNLQLVFATADPNIGVNGILTLRGTPVSNSRMLLSEYDTFGAATGSLDLQTSTAAPTGGYAFAVNGVDNTTAQNQQVIGGVLNFSGTSLNTANSVFDYNDGDGQTLLAQSFSSGSVNAPDSFGRIVITLAPGTSSVKSIGLTGYLVDGHTIQLLESQTDGLSGDLGGTALAQLSNAGQFSVSNVLNHTFVHASLGQDTNGPVYLGGSFSFAQNGSVSGLLAFNDIYNTAGKGNSFSGASYNVDQTGRVVITNVVPSNLSNITLSFILYLDGSGNGVILGADNIEQTTGLAYQQNGVSDYEGSYAVAAQGFLSGPDYYQPYSAVGPVTISSATFSGFTDYTSQDPNLLENAPTPFDNYSNVPLNGLENSGNGLITLSGLNSLDFSYSGGFGYYPIDANRVLAIDVDKYSTGFLMLESTSQLQSSH
jgi:hypothetical protein